MATPESHQPGPQLEDFGTTDQVVIDHARRILRTIGNVTGVIRNTLVAKIIQEVTRDTAISRVFQGALIRYMSMCGEVARAVLSALSENPDIIILLAIGDVKLPEFARATIRELIVSAHKYHLEITDKEGYGYDLASQGAETSRRALMDYFDKYYDFSGSGQPDIKEAFTKNACITNGGMCALDYITTAMINRVEKMNAEREKEGKGKSKLKHRFIQPDNSFSTWQAIVGLRSFYGREAEVHNLPTEQRHLLHLTTEQVDDFYRQHPHKNGETEMYHDSWYITPVGNPSGTSMTSEQLTSVCEAIVKNNPDAIIILDSVYIRTLPQEKAKALVAGVLQNPNVLNRTMFVESFSKTHGICGERIGTYFTTNADIFASVQNINMTLTAGNGRYKDGLALALANATPEQEEVLLRLHKFWAAERQGLYNYLMRPEFAHLFETDQTHITPEQLVNPLGLYLFMRLKPGIAWPQVLAETKGLGVPIEMGSGSYIRFSVGKITTQTFAKYAAAA